MRVKAYVGGASLTSRAIGRRNASQPFAPRRSAVGSLLGFTEETKGYGGPNDRGRSEKAGTATRTYFWASCETREQLNFWGLHATSELHREQ